MYKIKHNLHLPTIIIFECSGITSKCAKMAAATSDRVRSKDPADENFDYMFKLLIIGNSSVGKTSWGLANPTPKPSPLATVLAPGLARGASGKGLKFFGFLAFFEGFFWGRSKNNR